ncbi:aspartyl-tRNA synthetase cytoplasmic [Obba rivulosa]|uniref:Aspartate--tRNA ligase, cytoplasmic n=1 Tax=Obba rivulosa TaxID=1052685 RepID=A0A8E2AJF3_9APHY|nr:aspartyl-tRNA synthetase cytoplasmic [Obba rivulosa]
MSAFKRVLTKVSSIHSRSRSSSPSSPSEPRRSLAASSIKQGSHVQVDHTNAQAPTAAERQQVHDGDHRENRKSFTEQKEERKLDREAHNEEETKERREKLRKLREEDPLRDNYGDSPLNMSQTREDHHYTPLKEVATKLHGERVVFRARVHHIRPLGSKIVFIVFRNQLTTVQGVLTETEGTVSQTMVRWAEGINRESVVKVEGIVQRPPPDQEEVHGATVHEREVHIEKLYVIAPTTATLPFQVADVSRPVELQQKEDAQFPHVGDKTRLSNRILDLRSPTSQAIFRIHAGVCSLFREALESRSFIEIQSSKFQETSTEAGAAVFKVEYFRRPAYLAQSPQLAKQMCIAADMERVFEIGPVFRAENSNTHRHLTEFTGLDLEMVIDSHYHEVLDTVDTMFKYIFRGLQERYRTEIETVKKQFPHEDIVILDETPRLRFAEGIRMLRESGWHEDGSELDEWDDLSTPAERRLGQLVKEKYGTDYYILDKFPISVRPFYTMPDPQDDRLSNSFDVFLRGEEIMSGGQRIHYAPLLEERMAAVGIDPLTMKDYVDGFRWACPPHGGGGMGLERVVMLFLKLGDVRWASLFPRDPKSFQKSGRDLLEAALKTTNAMILHGPESETFQPGQPHGDMPPLENLIAKYGDSTNTSWTDPAWTVWRDPVTAAAVGYIPHNDFAVIFGNPLCELNQIPRVVKSFLAFLHEQKLKPVWCCVSKATEKYLAGDLGWSAVIAVAEERLNPVEEDPESNDKTVRRKIHRAEREGVKIVDVEGEMDPEVKHAIEERCKEWAAHRKGTQIHLTGVRPFDDMQHRKYFYAVDKDGTICALVVLAQLAPIHGFQIKWALDFPGAPLGTIEHILSYVIKKLGDAGVRSVTFGAGATGRLERAENVGGFRVRTLEKTYNGISHTFNLTNKGGFREKFGVHQEPMYICYPKGALGVKGIEAIMAALQKPK